MNYFIILFFQFSLFTYSGDSSQGPLKSGDVIVNVEDIRDIKGDLLVGIYGSKRSFRKVKKVYKYELTPVKGEKETVTLHDIPKGTYAVVIFQDLNGNRKFDSSFLGVPKEPFGFSTNFKVKRRAPKFHEVTFDHDLEKTEMTIKIQQW